MPEEWPLLGPSKKNNSSVTIQWHTPTLNNANNHLLENTSGTWSSVTRTVLFFRWFRTFPRSTLIQLQLWQISTHLEYNDALNDMMKRRCYNYNRVACNVTEETTNVFTHSHFVQVQTYYCRNLFWVKYKLWSRESICGIKLAQLPS